MTTIGCNDKGRVKVNCTKCDKKLVGRPLLCGACGYPHCDDCLDENDICDGCATDMYADMVDYTYEMLRDLDRR